MSNERYAFNFKVINMNKPILYSFHSTITIKEFIEFIKDEMSYFSPKNIEIFEIVCNSTEINKIDYNEYYTLHQIFKNRVKETSFYIKFI